MFGEQRQKHHLYIGRGRERMGKGKKVKTELRRGPEVRRRTSCRKSAELMKQARPFRCHAWANGRHKNVSWCLERQKGASACGESGF